MARNVTNSICSCFLFSVFEICKYKYFSFSEQSDDYRLRIGNYSGIGEDGDGMGGGDAMRLSNKAEDGIFSTSDRNRNSEIIQQYSDYSGDFPNIYDNTGWWFAECMAGNLNGIT